MNNLSVKIFTMTALLCGVFFLANCGGAATDKPANTAKTDAPKTETTSADSVGVPECDEYIKKYEACLTKIAAKAPQAQAPMKTAFEQQRNGFKQAAANPQSKATLASTCKQAIETTKQATSMYACEW